MIEAVLASSLIAQNALGHAVKSVADSLAVSLESGRFAVSHIVGRDPHTLDESGVAKAAIESLAESTSDGIVAPLFWLLVAGLPGIVIYKAVNTADSMVGHRNERYEQFGWASARLDDVLNWIPARLTALLIAGAAFLVRRADPENAWGMALRDGKKHASPNAGWPEAAFAGALGFSLGGPRVVRWRSARPAQLRRWPRRSERAGYPQRARALLDGAQPAAGRHHRRRPRSLAICLAFGVRQFGAAFGEAGALEGHRQTGDDEMHVGADFGETLMRAAGEVAEHPRQCIVGDDAEPDLVGDQDD